MVQSHKAGPSSKAVKRPPGRDEKDVEELELEARLFGTTSSNKKKRRKGKKDDDGNVEMVDDSMIGVDDSDLFEIDAPVAAVRPALSDDDDNDDDDDQQDEEDEDREDEDEEIDYEASDNESGEDEEEGEGSDDEDGSSSSSSSSGSSVTFDAYDKPLNEDADLSEDDEDPTLKRRKSTNPNAPTIEVPADVYDLPSTSINGKAKARDVAGGKQAVWADPADEAVSVDMEASRRLKKLNRGKGGDGVVNGLELEKRLREQFETLHPRPAWTNLRATAGTPSLRTLLTTTKSFIDSSTAIASQRKANGKSSSGPLPSGEIKVKRLRNANQANPTTGKRDAKNAGGGVVDFAWHPSRKVGVMAVAGGDRRVRFFNIDGDSNPTLMTLHIPSLPLTKSTFNPTGTSLLLTGTRPYYYTYDLQSQKCLRSPRNLWGSTPSPSAPQSLTRHSFSPDGSLLAVAGLRGSVQIVEWNQGAGAVLAELRSGRGGGIIDMNWSNDASELSILGGREGSEVEVWDIGSRRIVRKWKDDRAFGGMIMRSSRDGAYSAIGSNTGIVNLYSGASLRGKSQKGIMDIPDLRPEPIKSLEHLTTPISCLDFHPSGELMVTASSSKKDALRLYHLPTATAFSNWPTPATPLKLISATKFSSGGEYLGVGNRQGQVLLYSLSHYA